MLGIFKVILSVSVVLVNWCEVIVIFNLFKIYKLHCSFVIGPEIHVHLNVSGHKTFYGIFMCCLFNINFSYIVNMNT